MAAEKLDYKKEYKDLYMPGKKPVEIVVPPMAFVMVDGQGAPESPCYQNAISALYAVSFGIKMRKMKGPLPEGYFEYVVPPLEGLWWGVSDDRNDWQWTSMIRQPEFVTPELYEEIIAESRLKKPEIDFSTLRFQSFDEGRCVQIMHLGPYADEEISFDKMRSFMAEKGLIRKSGFEQKHHEIYLSDPRRTKAEGLKTVLRYAVS